MANITKWLGSRIKTDENNRLVTDAQIDTWNNKADSNHTHSITSVTGLQAALDGKAASSHNHTKSQITDFPSTMKNPTNIIVKLNGGKTEGSDLFTYDGSTAKTIDITPAGIGAAASSHNHDSAYAAKSHGHAITDITNLQTSLDGKAAASHSHAIANVTGLQAALDGKAASSHTHSYLPLAGGTITGNLNLTNGGKTIISLTHSTGDNNFGCINIYNENSFTSINPTAEKTTDEISITLPNKSGTLALITDIPSSIKNPNALSIQLNGGTATTYDGSTAKSINITAAGIGAAASSHTHAIANVTGLQDALDGKAASSHTHAIANVTGLQAALDGKAASSHNHTVANISDFPSTMKNPTSIVVKLNGGTTEGTNQFTYDGSTAKSINITPSGIGAAATSHSHSISNITNLQSALDGKAASSHSHAIANVTGLQDALDGKAASSHSHAIANVTGLQSTLDGKAAASHTHSDADITSISASKITGVISIDHIPQGALDRLVRVDDDTARFKLTTDNVQLGDTVKVKSTGLMYYVVDESKLSSEAGYEPYTAGSATSVPWSGVTGKPSTFTPSSHGHAISDITNLQSTLDGKAASSHSHAIANVTGLQSALDGKAASSHSHTVANITNFPSTMKNPTSIVIKLNGGTSEGTSQFTYDGSTAKSINITPSGIGAAAASHSHSIANVTGLQDALDGKAASSHSHAIANVTGLQSALDGKAASGHNHDSVYSKLGHTHSKDQVGLGNVDNTADSAKNVAMATKLQTYKAGSTTETYGADYPLFAQWDSNGSTINLVCKNYTVKVNSASVADSANAVAWGNINGKPSTFTPSSHGHAISDITNLQSTLNGKAASSHSHTVSNITDFPSSLKNPTSIVIKLNGGTTEGTNQFTYDGSATKTISITPAGIGAAASGHNHDSSYAAKSHGHAITDITSLQSALDGKAAASHSHSIANVSGLQSALDGKAASSHSHSIANVTNLQSTLDSKVNNTPTLVTNWNSATNAGFYYAAKGATNAPESTLGYFGQVCKSTTSIMQVIYPEGASGDVKQYMRRGTISGSTVTWETNWACITYALS